MRETESRLEITPDRVTDLSDGDFMPIPTEVLKRLGESRATAPIKNKVKSAIIAPKPVQYGLGRLFQTYNQNPLIEIMLFKDSARAYQWIGRTAKSNGK